MRMLVSLSSVEDKHLASRKRLLDRMKKAMYTASKVRDGDIEEDTLQELRNHLGKVLAEIDVLQPLDTKLKGNQ